MHLARNHRYYGQAQYPVHRANTIIQLLPDFVKDVKRNPSGKGFTHLGKDGVLRTLSGNYEVLDARGLIPEQIG